MEKELYNMREKIIADMQLCSICSPFFNRDKKILAHEIGLHVMVCPGGGLVDEYNWAPIKGHELYERHETARKLFNLEF